ncbi:transposable element Tcb1 transposase [Trichonephila clavipes]|nr:transposable element Tcb1 transposase [Trichonephila clavipes]
MGCGSALVSTLQRNHETICYRCASILPCIRYHCPLFFTDVIYGKWACLDVKYLGKSVVVLEKIKQLQCGYLTVGRRRVRWTDVVDHIHLSAPLHCLRIPFDAFLQQSGLSARRPLLGLPFMQNHRRLHHQWCDEGKMWVAVWNEVVFTDESRTRLQHHNGRIRVCRHRGERRLNSCVMHGHTGPALNIMVCRGIGYHSRTPLVRVAGTLNSQRYISEVLDSVVHPYLHGLATAIFQQDNARPQVTRIVQKLFVNLQIELLPWPARSPDLSPIENMWSMVDQQMTQITPQAATSDNLGQRVEAAWSAVPQNTSKISLNQCRGVWQR